VSTVVSEQNKTNILNNYLFSSILRVSISRRRHIRETNFFLIILLFNLLFKTISTITQYYHLRIISIMLHYFDDFSIRNWFHF